jgi:hypothetical protein
MNQNIIVFKYSLVAYHEYIKLIKNQRLKLNETEFFNILHNALLHNHLFINSVTPNDQLCSLFLNHARSLCELEALTFMPDESIPLYKITKENMNNEIQNINRVLNENNYNYTNNYTDYDWRKLISIMDTFREWTEDIKYFEHNNHEKINILMESPIISLCHI